MKKVISVLLFVFCISVVTDAQIVRTRSERIIRYETPKEKTPMSSNWLVKAGVGYAFGNYDDCYMGKLTIGYQREFSKNHLYWGAQAGFTTGSYPNYWYWVDYTQYRPAIYVGPTIGIRPSLGTNTSLDAHLGLGYGYVLNTHGHTPHNFVYELGIGVWYKRFKIGLEYQGFGNQGEYANGIMLTLGWKFGQKYL